jgi:class 3 adenylate cyclase/GAF domain-containing protein
MKVAEKYAKWISTVSLKDRDLYYKLNIIFGLLFLFPILGFIFFGIKYDILRDSYTPVFFLGVLVFSFLGFTMLRKLFDQINHISSNMYEKSHTDQPRGSVPSKYNELQQIIRSFQSIENQFKQTSNKLKKRASEISVLKELSELYYITFDAEEILAITLERALALTHSDVGSVLILNHEDPKSFTVKTSIGLDAYIKAEDRIDFETSPAKYAVLNKSPLLVKDIEKDHRFCRANRSHYASKSFICMPIKTSHEVIGVITVSRQREKHPFLQEDIDVLTPLVNHAAFTYQNLGLLREQRRLKQKMHSVDTTIKNIVSAAKGEDQVVHVLNKIKEITRFEMALVLLDNPKQTNSLSLAYYVCDKSLSIKRGLTFSYRDTIIEDVFDLGSVVTVDSAHPNCGDFCDLLEQDAREWPVIFFPLKIKGKVIGTLALQGVNSDYDANLAEMLTACLALALDRKALTSSVVKRNRELESIKQLGSALASSTFDMQQVLKYTIDMIQVIMDANAGSIFLVNNNKLICVGTYGEPKAETRTIELKLGQGIAGHVAARGEALVVNDISNSQHFSPDVDQLTGFKTHSVLCVPMISQGKVLGVLEVLNKKRGAFSSDDLDLLYAIGSSVSIAMENARLYQETALMAEHERGIRHMFQKFVPKEIVERIILEKEPLKSTIKEEMKTVTLLNIDLRKFSILTQEIGPQKTVALLNSFFTIMGGIVFKHNGIVDKYLGDGFLALFGAPVTGTNDADHALAAALEMKSAIKAVNAHFLEALNTRVDMGISVHTGEVVVGNIGFERKMDYTVIGDTVNGVFRLQELVKAYPNEVLTSESTLRATQSRFDVTPISSPDNIDPTLKGLQLYRLVGPPADCKK